MRINQYLAKVIGIGRRKADEIVSKKSVKINSHIANLGDRVSSDDQIEVFDGKKWKAVGVGTNESKVVLAYKPPRVMTTRFDPEGRKTIYDILPSEFAPYKSAGRLDYLSEGLIILSTNGHLILSITHPKFKTKKTYLVGITKPLSEKHIQLAGSGSMVIEDYKLNPVKIYRAQTNNYSYLNIDPKLYWYEFTLSEGRNRQIRKMVANFGGGVCRLIRIKHGIFELSEKIYKSGYVTSNISI